VTDDERQVLFHTVYAFNLCLEQLGRFELAQKYNEAVGPILKRVVDASKESAGSAGEKHGD